MSNEKLIDLLSSDLKPVKPRTVARDGVLIGGICLIELALLLLMGAMRPDMPHAMHEPTWWWKLISLGAMAGIGGWTSILSLDPVRSPRPGIRWILAILLTCLAAGWILDAGRNGLAALITRLDWRHGLQCVYKMSLLALPAMLGLGVLIRRGAPTDRTGTALAGGLAAAAWGAFVFVFACPSDDPLYVMVWYMVGCGAVTLVSRLLLARAARW